MSDPRMCLQYPKQPNILTQHNQPNNLFTETTQHFLECNIDNHNNFGHYNCHIKSSYHPIPKTLFPNCKFFHESQTSAAGWASLPRLSISKLLARYWP